MDIGSKLKAARTQAGLTQEQVAAHIGVTRQTISAWENNRSYPDVVSVIRLSDLYAVSLDELLKGDAKLIEHIDHTTNEVKSWQRFSKLIQIMVYLVIWAVSVLVFWLGGSVDAMGYSIVVLWLVLPVTTLILCIFIAKDNGWDKRKWLLPLFFGVMHMMAGYATFSLLNSLSVHKINLPDPDYLLPGMISAVIGLAIGSAIKAVGEMYRFRLKQKTDSPSPSV